jgi:hypothetical protein
MPFFTNAPDDWQRLDWQILRDGGIHLYWRREYLIEDIDWFAKHDYDVFEFACEKWDSRDTCSPISRVSCDYPITLGGILTRSMTAWPTYRSRRRAAG